MFGFVGYDEQNGNAIYTLMTKNLAETTIQGIELEFDWNAWENGRVYGWVAGLDAPQPGGAEDFADGYLCTERALLGDLNMTVLVKANYLRSIFQMLLWEKRISQ